MKNYLELTVRILPESGSAPPESDGPDQPARYQVLVDSLQGHGECTLELPFTLSELAGVVFGVAKTVRDASPEEDTPVAAGPSAREFGEMLYEALFKDEARDRLVETIAVAGQKPDTGTRIRLLMNLEGLGMAEVASLPWELMRSKGKDPLVVSARTPLVRSIDVPEPTNPRPFQPPLRIMALMSNPVGTQQLNLDEERARIEKEWALLPGVKVDFVRPVISEIRSKLAAAEYHVIHYMGHGDFDAANGGALLLEREDRTVDRVTGEEFAQMLEAEPLRLVFLNACKTATTSTRGGVNPFAGVATALIKKAAPAVVAMQFPISDTAAIDFAKTFYERIAQGIPVDAAVAFARQVLHSARPSQPRLEPGRSPREQSEWATPVLFMRSKDGMLFEPFGDVDTPERVVPAGRAGTTDGPDASMPNELWGPGAPDAHRVFLAAPSDDLVRWHRQLVKELANEGVRVISKVIPREAKAHAASVQAIVRSADLCVHLVGDDAGEEIEGGPLGESDARGTYAWEQCRIGLEAARSQLILMDEAKTIEGIEDPGWATYVRSLVERPRVAARFQVVHTDKNRMKGEILAKLQELKEGQQAAMERRTTSGPVQRAFVDAHRADFQHAQALETFLVGRNIDVEKKTSSDSPSDALAQFDVNLSKFPLYIVVSGSADKAWVENREVAALKSAARSRAKILIGRYHAAPGAGPGDVASAMQLLEVVAEMNGFDATSVDALIGRATTEKP